MAISTASEVLAVWPGEPPGSEGWDQQEQESVSPGPDQVPIVRNVVRPTLTIYLPDAAVATGTGVVVCPGGAFHFLAVEHEGSEVARWLTARGVAVFVLRYRVAPTPADDDAFRRHMRDNAGERLRAAMAPVIPLTIADGRQALALARERAAGWGVAPERIGMMGFSAGAMLTCGVALDADPAARPAFAAPIYGAPFDGALAVPPDAPPLFVAVAADDGLMAGPCLRLFTAWREAGRPAELHAYARGGHGFGMRQMGLPSDGWITQFYAWLGAEGLAGAGKNGAA